MPIEIRELVIKMTVEKPIRQVGNANTGTVSEQQLKKIKKEIIDICLDKTQDLIERRYKR